MNIQCFVMMPLQAEFEGVRKSIRQAAAKARVNCVWADELYEAGKITDQIISEIRKSHVCIGVLTGKNPNVAWELGYAASLDKRIVFLSSSREDLFFDVTIERAIIYDPGNLSLSLEQELAVFLVNLRNKLPEIPPEDLYGTEGHEHLTRVIAAKNIAAARYGFFDLITKAKSSIVLAAQNHYYFVENAKRQGDFRQSIFNFLLGDPERTVRIMLCDKEAKHAVQTWQYATTMAYDQDLEASTDYFLSLYDASQADSKLKGRLAIKKAEFVPLSITFVDPESRDGFLVITPNFYDARSRTRPCFIASRTKNDDIFQPYWASFQQCFIHSPDIR